MKIIYFELKRRKEQLVVEREKFAVFVAVKNFVYMEMFSFWVAPKVGEINIILSVGINNK